MPLYEAREFQAPVVIEKEDKASAPATPAPAQDAGKTDDESLFAPGTGTPTGSRTDRAFMDMVREGKSAQDVLKLIAGTSRNPFNRHVARLLQKTGASGGTYTFDYGNRLRTVVAPSAPLTISGLRRSAGPGKLGRR